MEIIKQHGTEIIVPLMNNTANIMKIGITQLTMRYLTKTNYYLFCVNFDVSTVKLGNKELFGHPKIVP